MSAVTRWIACIVLALSLGLHWAVLQSVAWTGMIVRYSQTDTLFSAIQKTFDGKHPCSLCRFINEARNQRDNRSEDKLPTFPNKLDPAPLTDPTWSCSAPEVAPLVLKSSPFPLPLTREPLTPPPRALQRAMSRGLVDQV